MGSAPWKHLGALLKKWLLQQFSRIAPSSTTSPLLLPSLARYKISQMLTPLWLQVLPGDFGMNFLNGQQFYITVLSPTTFSIPVDTSRTDSFSVGSNLTPAQCIPIAEVASSLLQAVQNSGVLLVSTGNGP